MDAVAIHQGPGVLGVGGSRLPAHRVYLVDAAVVQVHHLRRVLGDGVEAEVVLEVYEEVAHPSDNLLMVEPVERLPEEDHGAERDVYVGEDVCQKPLGVYVVQVLPPRIQGRHDPHEVVAVPGDEERARGRRHLADEIGRVRSHHRPAVAESELVHVVASLAEGAAPAQDVHPQYRGAVQIVAAAYEPLCHGMGLEVPVGLARIEDPPDPVAPGHVHVRAPVVAYMDDVVRRSP